MELVYLWVEDYKNIQKQGFNFSPRFRCEYDEDTKELNIVDKDETGEFYPKNFFGDNINVTAIVGENGSGKTSILKYIEELINNELLVEIIKLLDKDLNIDEANKKNYLICFNVDNTLVLYSDIEDIHSSANFSKLDSLKELSLNTKFIHSDCTLKNHDDTINIQNYDTDEILLNYLGKNLCNIPIKYEYIKFYIPKSRFDYYLKKIANIIKEKELSYQDYLSNLSLFDKIDLSKEEMKDLTLFKECQLFSQSEFYKNNNDKILHYKEVDITSLKKYSKDLKFFYFNDNNISLEELSHGEKILFLLIATIYNLIDNTKESNIFLFLDELELSLHPQWQKNFISYHLNNLFKFRDKNISIFFSTHSPFILSDLPKENIIFLEKGKQVYPFDDGKQTFGANIHTLLSHGFFMKDGLMGEFAKSKIDDVINYLNGKESEIKDDNSAQNIINIIGEPIIKRELQRMLKNKMELSNKTEIDTIKEEIKLLTKRLEDLEKEDK